MQVTVGDAIGIIQALRDQKLHGSQLSKELCPTVHVALQVLATCNDEDLKKRHTSLDIDAFREQLGCPGRRNSLRSVLSPRSSPRLTDKDWAFVKEFCMQHHEHHKQAQLSEAAASMHALNQRRFEKTLPRLRALSVQIAQSAPEEHSVDYNEGCQNVLLDLYSLCQKEQKTCTELALNKLALHWEAFARCVSAAHLAVYRDLESRWDQAGNKLSNRIPNIDAMCRAIDKVVEQIEALPEGGSRIARRESEQGAVKELAQILEQLVKRR